jgi:rRNA maturation endonuclease Nob1
MKKLILVVVVVLLVTGVVQVSKMLKAKTDLQRRVEHYVEAVDERSIESVKQELADDADKLGIRLSPADVEVVYRDTEQKTVAQKMVGAKLGAQYSNKYVEITAEYDARILGIPVRQTVVASHVRQVAAPVLPPSKEMQGLLDSHP